MQKERQCVECGIIFLANHHNVKYCDKCKAIARKRKMQEWRIRTGANEKQREKARIRLAEESEDKKQRNLEKRAEFERIASESIAEKERILNEKADQGDAVANMELELRKGGKLNPKYWYWYQVNMLKYFEDIGREPTTIVNGVFIEEPLFAEKVIESIKELNSISVIG